MGKNNNTSWPSSPDALFLSRDMRNNPYLCYKKLRQNTPVLFFKSSNTWVLSTYDNIHFALTNEELFSSENTSHILQPYWLGNNGIRTYPIAFEDFPEHKKHRDFFQSSFAKQSISALEPKMRETALSVISSFKNYPSFECIKQFSQPFTDLILAEFIGIDNSTCFVPLRRWAQLVETPPHSPSSAHVKELQQLNNDISHYLESLIHIRKKHPKNDLISKIANTTTESITDEIKSEIIELVLLAGMQAPPHLLSKSVVYLSHHPSLRQTLTETPSLIDSFIDELLRYDPPVHLVARRTKEDVDIPGFTIPANANVILIIASANHDPQKFLNPNIFDITRNNKAQLAFSGGSHHCIGSHFAKAETAIALEVFLKTFTDFSCLPYDKLSWFYSYSVHGLNELFVSIKK